jgi:hypothetical protein
MTLQLPLPLPMTRNGFMAGIFMTILAALLIRFLTIISHALGLSSLFSPRIVMVTL